MDRMGKTSRQNARYGNIQRTCLFSADGLSYPPRLRQKGSRAYVEVEGTQNLGSPYFLAR